MIKKLLCALCALPALFIAATGTTSAQAEGEWLGDPNTPFWQAPPATDNELAFLNCLADGESSGDPGAVSRTGKYRGAFQMTQTFQNGIMEAYEHGDYRGVPMNEVPIDVQYRTALLGLRDRGWQPWPTVGRACRGLL